MKKIIFSSFVIILLSQTVIAEGWGSCPEKLVRICKEKNGWMGCSEKGERICLKIIKTIQQDAFDDVLDKNLTIRVDIREDSVIVGNNETELRLSRDSNLGSIILEVHDKIKISNATIKRLNSKSYIITLDGNVTKNAFEAAKIEITNSTAIAINKAGKRFLLFAPLSGTSIGID